MGNYTDKRNDLGENKVGYLSVHYVVSLPNEIVNKPDYADLQNLKCEIQLRTVLQHAWAQIFHDRQYKFNNAVKLPDELKRTTNLIAGNLELSDRLISDVVFEYDTLLGNLDNTNLNKLLKMELNEETLSAYIKRKHIRQFALPVYSTNWGLPKTLMSKKFTMRQSSQNQSAAVF